MNLEVKHILFIVRKDTKNILSDQTRTCVGKDTPLTRNLIKSDYKLTQNKNVPIMKD